MTNQELPEGAIGLDEDIARYIVLVANNLPAALDHIDTLEQRVAELEREGFRYAEIICEGMAGRPNADDTARFVDTLARKETP